MQQAALKLRVSAPRLVKDKVCWSCPENGIQPAENFYANSTRCKKCYAKSYQDSKTKVIIMADAARKNEIERLAKIINTHLNFHSKK